MIELIFILFFWCNNNNDIIVNNFVVEPIGNSEYSFSLSESIEFKTYSFLSSYSTNFCFFHKFSFYYHT